MPDFTITHRDYQRYYKRWKMAYCFFKGGIHVSEPDYDVSTIRYLTRRDADSSGGLDPEESLQLSDFDVQSSPSQSFLWKHERETVNEYSDRSRRQINWPVFQKLVNTFVSGILRADPTVGDPGKELSDPWRSYVQDVDLAGTPMSTFRRRALALALCFGRVHAVTDRPPGDVMPLNRLQQETSKQRAYSYLVTPLNVTDWLLDDYGQYVWVVIREPEPDTRAPGRPQADFKWQYRVWYKDSWELWRSTDTEGEYIQVDGAEHDFGRVPVNTLYVTREGENPCMAAESPLSDFLDLNRHVLNKFSELDETERSQTFDILLVPGEGTGALELGHFRGMTFNGESGAKPDYISPNPQHASGKWDRISAQMFTMRQLASTGRGKAEYSKEERSGDAIMLESADQQNQMASWASAGQDFEDGLYRNVASWENIKDNVPQSNWSRKFDVRGLMTQVNEVMTLAKVPGVTLEASAAMAAPLVDRKLQEHGLAFDARKMITNGIVDLAIDASEDAESTNALLETVGGIDAIVRLSQAVSEGTLDRGSAIAILVNVLGIDSAVANQMVTDNTSGATVEVVQEDADVSDT